MGFRTKQLHSWSGGIYRNNVRVATWDRDSASLENVKDEELKELYFRCLKVGMGACLGEDDSEEFRLTSDNGNLFEVVLKKNGYQVGVKEACLLNELSRAVKPEQSINGSILSRS